ncbi:MAG: hypothetical protein GW763_15895 [Paraglaciecola sp.]|nr:hypothetical protein [Paraglaciecola sp.]NCT49435.1 hypothetical protein [Paraglaciecola sp.]
MPNQVKFAIALLMSVTIFRAQTVLFLSSVEMFGGIAPDAWFAPWFSDALLGFLVPLMVYLFWQKRSTKIWGALIIYNAVGAFDYATGLATQFTAPMPVEMASAMTVYLGIGVFMLCQLIALVLLFRTDVIAYFTAHR